METNPHTNPWRTLLATAQTANPVSHMPFAQLATVAAGTQGHETRPSVRTVAIRGFLDDGRLLITTDTRNDKITDLAEHPLCELCWYFTQTREQFRLSARAQIVAAPQARLEAKLEAAMQGTWQARRDVSRNSFTWPQPKRKRGEAAEFALQAGTTPPDNFALLLLDVITVDYLNVLVQPNERTLFTKLGGQWLARAVNP
jgi:pyridoxamine 5'-phosphate oxidase